jgi:hypothetical protein
MIPIFSWLALRGRCSGCHSRISAQYPLIEAANAGLWLLVYSRFRVYTRFNTGLFVRLSTACGVVHRRPHQGDSAGNDDFHRRSRPSPAASPSFGLEKRAAGPCVRQRRAAAGSACLRRPRSRRRRYKAHGRHGTLSRLPAEFAGLFPGLRSGRGHTSVRMKLRPRRPRPRLRPLSLRRRGDRPPLGRRADFLVYRPPVKAPCDFG